MHLIYKATYHDRQTSYNWQAHITDDFGNVVCGRKLNEFWDVYSEYFPSLEVVFQSHDPQGICANCRRSKRLTQRAPDATLTCPDCDGTGYEKRSYLVAGECQTCKGAGHVKTA